MSPQDIRALYAKVGIETGGQGGKKQASGGGQPAGTKTAGGGAATGQKGAPAGPGGARMAGKGGEQPGGGMGQMREAPAETAVIWKRTVDKGLEPVQIRVGITDHTVTEVAAVVKGTLNPGDDLVVGSAAVGAVRAPGMGGGPGGRPPGR
jgi:hypothetical protein